ncbi:MAG TPA: 4-hydroxybenzoate octaprenyltransferase, partial [Candidatus Tenderia electrophaga]|nr:4-hydroxybenzoate octaprenyltransferase [Candidatus Tenderia electrophaga]
MLLMRLDKPIGIMLLLWPTLWALWIAGEGNPDSWVVTVFVAGVFLMRSAGCVIN